MNSNPFIASIVLHQGWNEPRLLPLHIFEDLLNQFDNNVDGLLNLGASLINFFVDEIGYLLKTDLTMA